MNANSIKEMIIARETVLELLRQLDELEKDKQTSNENKRIKIQEIGLQLEEINARVDNFKKEIKLISAHKTN